MSDRPATDAARKEIIAISIVTALCLAGDSFLYIALPLCWQEAGLASLLEVGVILSANRLIRLPLNPLIAKFYNHCSCRTGILLATGLSIVSTLGYGLCKGLLAILAMRFLWGLAWTLLRLGTLFSIVRVGSKETIGYLTGLNNGLYRLGSLGGMLLGGVLAGAIGLSWTAYLLAAVACLAPVVTLLRVPKSEASEKQDRTRGSDLSLEGFKSVFRADRTATLWVMMTAFLVAMAYQGVVASSISAIMGERAAEGLVVAGLTISAAALSGGISSLRWVWEPFLAPWFGRLSDGSIGRVKLTAIAFFIAASTMLALSVPGGAGMVCGLLILVLMGATMLTTVSDSLGNETAMRSGNTRAFLSVYALFTDLGAAMGPLFAYTIITIFNVTTAWALMGLLLLWFGVRWWRKA